MVAPAPRSFTSATGNGDGLVTVHKPAGVVAGDVLLMFVHDNRGATITALTQPPDWTEAIETLHNNDDGQALAAYFRIADGTEPASWSFTFPDKADSVIICAAYSGAQPPTPESFGLLQTPTLTTGLISPAGSTTLPDARLVRVFSIGRETTISTPLDVTSRIDVQNVAGVNASMRLVDEVLPAAGSYGSRTATAGTTGHGAGWTVRLNSNNVAPNAPTLNAPSGTITSAAPTLSATVVDPNGGTVQAYFEVSTTSDFSNVVFSGLGAAKVSGTAVTLRSSPLNPSTAYYWRAKGYDGTSYGPWSATGTFTTPAAVSVTFAYTGAVQTFTVPPEIAQVTIDLHGAQGVASAKGGKGGRVQGALAVTPSEILNIYVGGTNRWNGGGAGYRNGGDATDIRRGTTLASRLAVAAGGGGEGRPYDASSNSSGGAGGGLTGANGTQGSTGGDPGRGATQTAGGAPGVGSAAEGDGTAGVLGVGGAGYRSGGGGGGGYYGGGGASENTGGGEVSTAYDGGGGGGGSSLVPAGGSTTAGARTGAGLATITYVPLAEAPNRAPTAPTLGAPAANVVSGSLKSGGAFDWTHNDLDGPNTQGGFAFKRTRLSSGVSEWWNGSAWLTAETYVPLASQSLLFPAGAWSQGIYTWTVSTADVLGVTSPYATARKITVPGGLAMII